MEPTAPQTDHPEQTTAPADEPGAVEEQDEELDEALEDSFPGSDAPSSWAGPDLPRPDPTADDA